MTFTKHALALTTALLVATTANAQTMNTHSDYYGELGYLGLRFKDESSVTPKLARLVIGKTIHQNLAVEGMLGINIKSESTDSTYSYKGRTYGAYLKPQAEIANGTAVFARIGVAKTTLISNLEGEFAQTKAAYGLGIQTTFSKNIYGQLDYMYFGKKDGLAASGITLSVGTLF